MLCYEITYDDEIKFYSRYIRISNIQYWAEYWVGERIIIVLLKKLGIQSFTIPNNLIGIQMIHLPFCIQIFLSIDHAHHDTYVNTALDETVAMDKALETVLNMVELEETLIIVTADHGHTMTMGGYQSRYDFRSKIKPK